MPALDASPKLLIVALTITGGQLKRSDLASNSLTEIGTLRDPHQREDETGIHPIFTVFHVARYVGDSIRPLSTPTMPRSGASP